MNCPSCGRPIHFEEKYAKVVACPYCNSILEFGSGELTKTWEQGDFIAFPSIFELWKITEYQNKKILVKWQIRYETDAGFFDDFFVEIDWRAFYVREDDGQISFLIEAKNEKDSLTLVDKIAGMTFSYNSANFYIEEVGIFRVANIRGFVSTSLQIGVDYEYLTAITGGKKYFFEKNSATGHLKIWQELGNYKK